MPEALRDNLRRRSISTGRLPFHGAAHRRMPRCALFKTKARARRRLDVAERTGPHVTRFEHLSRINNFGFLYFDSGRIPERS